MYLKYRTHSYNTVRLSYMELQYRSHNYNTVRLSYRYRQYRIHNYDIVRLSYSYLHYIEHTYNTHTSFFIEYLGDTFTSWFISQSLEIHWTVHQPTFRFNTVRKHAAPALNTVFAQLGRNLTLAWCTRAVETPHIGLNAFGCVLCTLATRESNSAKWHHRL